MHRVPGEVGYEAFITLGVINIQQEVMTGISISASAL